MISDQQTAQEWLWFLDQLPPLKSVLEIGSYNGNSLLAWASSGHLMPGAIIRSIDLGDHGTAGRLKEVCAAITAGGLDAQAMIANSHDPSTQFWAQKWAPYDVIFIDGDHSYEGVKADWQGYAPMGKIVALHDVGGHEAGCVKFWRELRSNGLRTLEMTAHPRYQNVVLGQQGIGIVWRE